MKNLKKLSRENLKSVNGGVTPECVEAWSLMTCFSNQNDCLAYATSVDPSFPFCGKVCNKWCFS